MAQHFKSQSVEDRRPSLLLPLVISLAGHLLLFGSFLYSPPLKSSSPYLPGLINVQIVELSAPAPQRTAPAAAAATPPAPEPVPELTVAQETPAPTPVETVEKPPEVSVAPAPPKPKTALKYKTIKSKDVLKSALQRLEEKVESQPDRQLQDTIKRLKDQVEKEGRPEGAAETQASETAGTGSGAVGLFGQGSAQEIEAIDLYRHEVAYAINKNWAYSQQLAGGRDDMAAQLAFKVMPDGKITDVFFTDRSGNAILDDSAYKAIMKSSPVNPHPPGLRLAYVEMGLRFTPKGIQ